MDSAIEREQKIFEAALELVNLGERDAFLDQACAGDPKLRANVSRLFAAHEKADGFFTGLKGLVFEGDSSPFPEGQELDAARAGLNSAVDERIAAQIGHYRILEKIGEGGCGAVFMAEQEEPIRRRVALKVIKLGMDTKAVIARFDLERQALALMDHPNIAHVLDAGATETGRPYFVMELVKGVRITEYCDANHLGTRQRLGLFIQVCHAIQHAHQKGIIHRDIKPSNILVTLHDGIPVPRVIDFGVAKATGDFHPENTASTSCGQFIGTPAYMSPEQAKMGGLAVDTRSDIYSLGVLLYELLTGTTPFDQKELLKSGLDQMRRTLQEKEPHRPSTKLGTLDSKKLTATALHRRAEPSKLRSQLSGDLDWIVMKALEKDRARRYETANSLAMDVQRHLNNEPVVARPPSRLYRFQKLVRRNKTTVSAASVVIMALIIAIGFSTWLLLNEWEARLRAAVAEEQARLLRQQAKNRQKLTQATVFLSRDKIEEADRLVGSIRFPEPNLEYATLFRALGDWNVVNAHWQQAADRFTVLIQVKQPEDWDATTLDYLRYGPLLLELSYTFEYQQLRKWLASHYAETTNPVAAERVIRISLLAQADTNFLAALQPLLAIAAKPPFEGRTVAWRAFSLALMEYRLGNDAGAESWCEKSIVYYDKNPALNANLQVLLAMIHHHRGETDLAHSELAQTRGEIESYFNRGPAIGSVSEGYWFDWVFARILHREAEALIGEPEHRDVPQQAGSYR